MNKMPSGEVVVSAVAGRIARLLCDDASAENRLLDLGFSKENDALVKVINDDSERRSLVKDLIDMNAIFVRGREWSPAELLDYYREQGFSLGSYRTIEWRDPATFHISTEV